MYLIIKLYSVKRNYTREMTNTCSSNSDSTLQQHVFNIELLKQLLLTTDKDNAGYTTV